MESVEAHTLTSTVSIEVSPVTLTIHVLNLVEISQIFVCFFFKFFFLLLFLLSNQSMVRFSMVIFINGALFLDESLMEIENHAID